MVPEMWWRNAVPLERPGLWSLRYGINNKITVYRSHDNASQRAYDSSDDALEYMIGDDRLRDIITQVEVLFRSI